jgi:hypothetical protein
VKKGTSETTEVELIALPIPDLKQITGVGQQTLMSTDLPAVVKVLQVIIRAIIPQYVEGIEVEVKPENLVIQVLAQGHIELRLGDIVRQHLSQKDGQEEPNHKSNKILT